MFIPVPNPDRTPSPRVQELEQRLSLTIAEFQQRYPDLSQEEIRQAALLATGRLNAPARAPARAFAAAAVAGAAVLLGMMVYATSAPGHLPAVPIAAVAAAFVVVALVVRARRG